MVVAHLAERTPEIHCTNSIIGKLNCLKDENKVKEAGIGPFKKLGINILDHSPIHPRLLGR